jgi:HlyD family secretion protein
VAEKEQSAGSGNSLFRGDALKRLNSPEQLDQRIRLIPAGMLAMAAGATTIVGAMLIWAVFGSIPTSVKGQGVVLADGQGSYTAQPVTSGAVSEILVKPGDRVAAGAVVARVQQDTLQVQLAGAKARYASLQKDLVDLRKADASELAQVDDMTKRQQAAIDEQIRANEARIQKLSQIVNGYQSLQAKGVMSQVELVNIQQQYDQTVLDVANAKARRIEIEAATLQKHDSLLERERQLQDLIGATNADVERLEAEVSVGSAVKAPIAGTVEDVRVGRGDVVSPGTVVATIAQTAATHYQVVAVFDDANAKRVLAGMATHVVPATAKEDEYGSMKGVVKSITDRPVTTAGLNAILRNPDLTKSLMGNRAPLLAEIDLQQSPATASGFVWWAGKGPPYPITHGTRADVEVTIKETPPIGLVIPALRKLFGIEG